MNVIVILCDTLRRDHCCPYTGSAPINAGGHPDLPAWSVPTPNMDRLAARGTVFENAYCGSSPCMPARRDLYTGRHEFLERGWGPLAEDDLDLPRQVSGQPNRSLHSVMATNDRISYLITDHFHLWEQGAGNYHMGYSGFDFIRGAEADAWYTHPYEGFAMPPADALGKNERHWRNIHHIRHDEADWFAPQVFRRAAEWLEHNHGYEDFYLHIDCFDPHEPWDPPQDLLDLFDPDAYHVDGWMAQPPYSKWRETMTEAQFHSFQARYAAKVVLVDRWLGHLLDSLDRLNLWEDTLVIFTTDHGIYLGEHGRIGKLQTHQFSTVSHIPFIVAHPQLAHGERRDQLVQLVDIYPTVLEAVGRAVPPDRHGVSLLPVLADATAPTRDYAVCGVFGQSVTLTDGTWTLHQSPVAENQPLYWHGYHLARFLPYNLGRYENGVRHVDPPPYWTEATWLSYKPDDAIDESNLADAQPERVAVMQAALRDKLRELGAPPEQAVRLGLETP